MEALCGLWRWRNNMLLRTFDALLVVAQVSSAVALMREGRCALHTRLAVYKFLIAYGLHFSVLNIACYWSAWLQANLQVPKCLGADAHAHM